MPPITVLSASQTPPNTGELGQAMRMIAEDLAKAETLRQNRQLTSMVLSELGRGSSVDEIMGRVSTFQPEQRGGLGGLVSGLGRRFGGGADLSGFANLGLKQRADQPGLDIRQKEAKARTAYWQGRASIPKQSEIQELMAEGYDAGQARDILDIKHGLKPRASATRTYDQMDDISKLNYLTRLEETAAGQYFGIEGGNEQPRMPKVFHWVQEQKSKLGILGGGGTPEKVKVQESEVPFTRTPGDISLTAPTSPVQTQKKDEGNFTHRVYMEVFPEETRPRNETYTEAKVLESIWDELTEDERVSAYRKIAVEGWTGQEVLDAFENAR